MSEGDVGGAIAHPHDEDGGGGMRGGKVDHPPGEEGETATVTCLTSKGPFMAKLHRDWAPNGYDRAVALFQRNFFDQSHFFRMVPHYLVQFGISYSLDKSLQQFANTPIPDDPQLDPPIKFKRGTMSFAGSGPNSRTSQMFISYASIDALGKELWETPFGEVFEGMENVEQFYSYGDMPPWGKGPVQQKIRNDPNYIASDFPLTDSFQQCQVTIDKKITEAPHVGGMEQQQQQKQQKERAMKAGNTDDTVEQEQRQYEAEVEAKDVLGPFADMLQITAVVGGVVVLFLFLAALSQRRGNKSEKKN